MNNDFIYKPLGSKKLKTTPYLYGVVPTHFESMPYYEAIEEKINLADKLIKELCEQQSELFNKRNTVATDEEKKSISENYRNVSIRLSDVIEAREYNVLLLEEYKKYKKKES